eukprot:CAMPEP_0171126220 /NCGR_PEP_ID=MMETSP0766_2-20121228/112863_1 /TAXON_ID=439317 /ORGANISM="Gambierdiscus australes, Strain CAWD 149" /LENGTH=54 /DNA_ID=CAMNT_0011589243 /DNA_START=145 /DNA_END=305 /DNA_ORIENTATION=-
MRSEVPATPSYQCDFHGVATQSTNGGGTRRWNSAMRSPQAAQGQTWLYKNTLPG